MTLSAVLNRALELKVRHVRTQGGVDMYGEPIGAVITRKPLEHLASRAAHAIHAMASGEKPFTQGPVTRTNKYPPSVLPSDALKYPANPKIIPVPKVRGAAEKPIPGYQHLFPEESEYAGYEAFSDSKHRMYYVYKGDASDAGWHVLDENDEYITSGKTKGEALAHVEDYIATTAKDKMNFQLRPGMKWATDADRKRLVVPPDWRGVQVRTSDKTPLIMLGSDAKGRSQPRYDADYRGQQDGNKFRRMEDALKQLSKINTGLKKKRGDDNADCLQMIVTLGMRPGTPNSMDKNKADVETYGASTLLAKHVNVTDTGYVRLDFTPGKKKSDVTIKVRDKELADMLRERLKTRRGNDSLFPDATASDMSDLLSELIGKQAGVQLKIKDMRTLRANIIARAMIQRRKGPAANKTEFNKWRREVLQAVADVLGNTPTVVKSSYVNPVVFDSWVQDPSWL